MVTRRVTSPDPVLHRIAPLGLAAAAGTALVVDLDPTAVSYPGPTLADLIGGELTASHLAPRRAGVAVVAGGGVSEEDAADVLAALVAGWPSVVLRVPAGTPAVPVLALDPPELRPPSAISAVWQSSVRGSRAPGLVLPPIRRSQVRALCRGTVEPRSAWVRAWSPVWGPEWT